MCDVLSPMPLILPHEPDIKPGTGWRFDILPMALIGVSLAFLGLFLALPLLVILTEALAKGLPAYWDALAHDDVVSAVLLSLGVTFLVLPVNIVGGLAFAWLL